MMMLQMANHLSITQKELEKHWKDHCNQEIQRSRPSQPHIPSLYTEVTIPLKYLGNFWRSLDLPFTNCEVELDLSWTKDCAFIKHHNNITGVILWLLALNFIFQ